LRARDEGARHRTTDKCNEISPSHLDHYGKSPTAVLE
jgi:hypothetical protein